MSSYLDKYELLQIHIEQYRQGDYSFIYETEQGINYKQKRALELLNDKVTNIIDYGGGAGGAKSWTGGAWQFFTRQVHADTKGAIGRAELKELRQSTLETLRKISKYYSAKPKDVFDFNGQDNFIEFENGSKIFLISLAYKPSIDPEYDSLGSLEITDVWIEELAGCNPKGADVLKSRAGRWNNDKYNLPRKIFRTFNPQKNHVYKDIYKPFKEDKLPINHVFIPALVTDNPNIDKGYIENLMELKDESRKQRLLYGNFEYDDDPNALTTYEKIVDSFDNSHVIGGSKYITADIATRGSDEAVIGVWNGWILEDYKVLPIIDSKGIETEIRVLKAKHSVPNSHICYDSDGIGDYLGSYIQGAKGFINASSPLEELMPDGKREKPNYRYLKTQCEFKLAEKINNNEIWLRAVNNETEKEKFSQELSQLKEKNADKDSKKETLSKEDIKQNIGRSPDRMDMLKMRVYFDLVNVERPKMRSFSV